MARQSPPEAEGSAVQAGMDGVLSSGKQIQESENLLRLAMQAADMGAWELNFATNSIKWSYAHFALFGVRPDEFDGTPQSALRNLHPDDRDRVWSEVAKARADHRTELNQEFRVVWPDGSIHWIASRAKIHYSPSGEAIRVVGVNWDWTDRKKAADLLAASEEKFRASVETVPQAFGIFSSVRDGAGNIVDFRAEYANAAALSDLGRHADQYVGRRLCEVLPGHRETGLLEAYAEMVETGNPLHLEAFRFTGDFGGQVVERRYDIHATKLGDGFACVWQDVTQRVNSAQELARTNQRLQALMDALPVGVSFSDDPSCRIITGNKTALRQFEGVAGDNLSPVSSRLGDRGTLVKYSRNGVAVTPDKMPLQRAVRENRVVLPEEVEVELPSGRKWIAEASGAPVRDSDGNVVGGLAVITDITERKRAEQALRNSEALYRTTFDNAAVGIAHVGLDGRWLRFNDAVCRITGYSRDELVTMTFTDITHPEDIEPDWQHVNDLFAGKFPSYQMEKRYLRKDGSIVWIDLTVSLHRDSEGHPQHMISLIQDISDRKEAQAALGESEKRFRELAESLPQLIWVTDPQGANTYCNHRFYDYTGLSPERMMGFQWHELLHPDDVAPTMRKWTLSLRSGEPYFHEYRLKNKDGDYRYFLARAMPVFDAAGKIKQWLGSSTDVHDQKLAEEALRRTEKLAVAGRLAMSISHEINNPLAAVTNLMYLIGCDQGLSKSTREFLSVAERELERVSQVVTQTLRFARNSSRMEETDLRDIADSAIALFQPRFDAAGISIERDYRSQGVLVAYRQELRQVMANLLGNAHDAMRRGGKLKIRIRDARSYDVTGRRGLKILVADNGTGIAPEVRKRIFEPFVTTKEETGTGLGLWVTQEIIHKHGGRISMRTSTMPGRSGTVFSVFLPMSRSEERPASNSSDEITASVS